MGRNPSQNVKIQDGAYKLDRVHVFHSRYAQRNLNPTEVVTGHGVWLRYGDGREIFDFISQQVNVNIGHQHPKVIEGIKKRVRLLCTIGPDYASLVRDHAVSLVARRAPEGFDRVFFTSTGTGVDENTMRAVRLLTSHDKILSPYRCYHGNIGATISATGDWCHKLNNYFRGHVCFFTSYLYRSEFSATAQEEEYGRTLAHLEHVTQSEDPDTIAAVLLKSVPDTADIITLPEGHLKGTCEITKRYNTLMITDEIMTGFNCAGFWLALDDYNYTPDTVSFAKDYNFGYMPADGVITSDPAAHRFDDIVFPDGLTYSGYPLAMGTIVVTQEAMEEEHTVDSAYTTGKDVLGPQLIALYDKHLKVSEVCDKGVFWVVEIAADHTIGEPLDNTTMKQIVAGGDRRDLILDVHSNHVHVTPPCVISADEATQSVKILDQVLTAAGC